MTLADLFRHAAQKDKPAQGTDPAINYVVQAALSIDGGKPFGGAVDVQRSPLQLVFGTLKGALVRWDADGTQPGSIDVNNLSTVQVSISYPVGAKRAFRVVVRLAQQAPYVVDVAAVESVNVVVGKQRVSLHGSGSDGHEYRLELQPGEERAPVPPK